jgi:hypothetical protein
MPRALLVEGDADKVPWSLPLLPPASWLMRVSSPCVVDGMGVGTEVSAREVPVSEDWESESLSEDWGGVKSKAECLSVVFDAQ